MSGIMQLLLSGRPQVASDPYFEYTTLLLPGNGTNGAQNNTFLDSSTNNFTITRNGNTTQGTFSPFSQTGWGNYFDGNGDYLNTTSTQIIPSGSFTVEAWVYPTSSSDAYAVAQGATGNAGRFSLGITSSLWYVQIGSASVNAGAVSLNQWTHLAATFNGSTLTLYVNGTSVGTAATSTNVQNTTLRIGSLGPADWGTFYWTGYISNVRAVNSVVYSSSFTPSTTPLTAISGTTILTCQSNRFIDNSTNNFAITRNGDVSVQAFSPFNPTAAWSAATNGGSGYFDGSGDYLDTSTSSSAFAIGTGQFTVEAWVYTTDTVWALVSSTTTGGLVFGYNIDSGTQGLSIYRAGVATAVASNVQIPYGAWTHIAVTRDGSSNVRFYSNGVQIGSTTNNTTDFGTGNQVFRVGADGVSPGSYIFTGYAASVRVIKGAAQYTGTTYTVPTAPLEAIANTSLLLNFTNAGIYDATSKNDLETVGNAQISTAQSKFGGSSIYLDGSGDYLDAPSNLGFTFGTGDFTVEFWLNTSLTGFNIINPSTATGSGYWALLVQSGNLRWNSAYNVTNLWEISASAILNGAWHHVAIARASGSTKVFYDGVLQTTQSDTTNYSGVAAWRIGSGNIAALNGYIQDLRITKGYARYTANFTAPTAAFPLF